MNAKLKGMPHPWVDPDDAPELTDADFARGTWRVGDKIVTREVAQTVLRRGRPPAANTKLPLTVRYDADIVAAFKATGRGWQTRMNDALRDWLASHH